MASDAYLKIVYPITFAKLADLASLSCCKRVQRGKP